MDMFEPKIGIVFALGIFVCRRLLHSRLNDLSHQISTRCFFFLEDCTAMANHF